MNTNLKLYDPTLRIMVSESVHKLAQAWGANFIRNFIETGTNAADSYEAGLADYALEHRNHLAHCFENDRCQDICKLVDSTALYCREDYLDLYWKGLAQIGVSLDTAEQEYLIQLVS